MGRTQQNSDEGTPQSVLAADAQETLSDEILDWLHGLKRRIEKKKEACWERDKDVTYAAANEENMAYTWLIGQIGLALRTASEQKALRSASEHERGVMYAAQQLQVATGEHLELATACQYSPVYIQTLHKLRADLMLELDEFV